MTAALTPSSMSDLALRQRIEARLEQPSAAIIHLRPKFDATVRQADAIGACMVDPVVNRYRYHGTVVRRAIAIGDFFGEGSLTALAVAVGLMGIVMAVVA